MKLPLRYGGATCPRNVTNTVQTVQYSDRQCTVHVCTQQQYWHEHWRCSWLHAGVYCIAPRPFTRFVFYSIYIKRFVSGWVSVSPFDCPPGKKHILPSREGQTFLHGRGQTFMLEMVVMMLMRRIWSKHSWDQSIQALCRSKNLRGPEILARNIKQILLCVSLPSLCRAALRRKVIFVIRLCVCGILFYEPSYVLYCRTTAVLWGGDESRLCLANCNQK